jgi:hypothetical protein
VARSGAILTGLALFAASLVGVPASAVAADPEPAWAATDFVTLDSAPGHSAGEGRSLSWTGDEITAVEALGSFLVIEAGGPDAPNGSWSWMLRAPEGQPLRAGDYEDANGSMTASGQPGLMVGGDGSGCNEAHGRFRILELAADLSRIWILYEHRCQNDDPSLAAWGEIRIGMPDVGPALTLLPETLRLPDWYPGLDAVAQPAMVFNTGTSPLTVTDVAVTSGQSDFRVVGGLDSCADLAPRESCRVMVGFRPSVAGTRTGTLRLTTSAGIRDVPLSGYGYPGTTEFRVRSGGTESYVVTPDSWTMIAGAADRLVRFYGREPGYGGAWIDLRLTAPVGGFRAGHTYSSCCTDVGPSLDLAITGRAASAEGSFTVHEVAYDNDGALQRFSATFRTHRSGWYVGSIAWRATTPPSVPAIPPDSAQDPLTVATDRSTYSAGDVGVVTVTVPGGAGHDVTLYAARHFGGAYVVGSKPTDALGHVRFEVPLTSEFSFLAASGAHSGAASVEVVQHPRVVAKGYGQVGRRGKFLLFRAGRPAHLAGAASPVLGEECLSLQVQRRRNGGWRAVEVADPCLWVTEGAIGKTALRGRAGERKRVRLRLPDLPYRPAANSNWVYMEFVRRRAG